MTQQRLFDDRTEAAEAAEAEFYATPTETIRQFLRSAQSIEDDDTGDRVDGLPSGLWVDAGSGTGALARQILITRDVKVVGVELRQSAAADAVRSMPESVHGRYRQMVGNWLLRWLDESVDLQAASVVVMNSPFSLTNQFVQTAFDRCPVAWVWSLQRQSWRKPSGERTAWLLGQAETGRLPHWPEYVLQCIGSRPSFTGNGRTDGCEYEWCGWSPNGRTRRHSRWCGPCR